MQYLAECGQLVVKTIWEKNREDAQVILIKMMMKEMLESNGSRVP